ncbi:S9 family peptidase [Woeseiaceae bacterium]|nr:S9 family peptidase [Woeseiaceae bacterium]
MKKLTELSLIILILLYSNHNYANNTEKLGFNSSDIYRIKDTHSLDLSSSAKLLLYVTTAANEDKDNYSSSLWLHNTVKKQLKAVIKNSVSLEQPRFSPNEKYIAYLAAGKGRTSDFQQLWLLNTKSKAKRQLTKIENNITDFQWSPDSQKIALVISTKAKMKVKEGTPLPYVIDRFQFKKDGYEYLGNEQHHIHVISVKTKKINQITDGLFNEKLPAWSPDGTKIAYTSKKGDFDRHNNWDIYITDLESNSSQLTTHSGADADPDWGSRPQWSPDGTKIAYMRNGDPNLLWYSIIQVAIIDVDTRKTELITQSLDRNTTFPAWGKNDNELFFVLEDDTNSQLVRYTNNISDFCKHTSSMDIDSYSTEQLCDYWQPSIELITTKEYFISNYSKDFVVKNGTIALNIATSKAPKEIFLITDNGLEQISSHNNKFLDTRIFNPIEYISYKSFDGTKINGMMVKPIDFNPDKKYPLIIRIHGGPVSQYDLQFYLQWQIFASNDYIVLAVNPRGSSGRGENFQKAIYGDWGNIDGQDIMAAADYAISSGFIDEEKLGIGGWSYGSMLTNYVIAKDNRFKAATSGAGISNILSGFGDDQYIREYIIELGLPWEDTEKWLNASTPFFNANKITTPTLFLVGEKDYNVPLIGSEQMYQALKYLSIPTQLIIYPDEHHSFSTPSYEQDVLDRYLDWYKKYLY